MCLLPIQFLPPARKYLKKIKDKELKRKFLLAIQEIRSDPNCGSMKTGDLHGIYGYDIYYQKTNYEVAYRLTTNKQGQVVVVILAGTRENFWNELKNYLQN